MNYSLTFDDIQLIPKYSEIESRTSIDLSTRLSRNFHLKIPYVASPMDTVCESVMAKKMMRYGGAGCIHRFMSIEDQCEEIQEVSRDSLLPEVKDVWGDYLIPIFAAVGANGDYFERALELWNNGCNIILIDVAHGHHRNVKEAIRNIKSRLPVDVIAGNIATSEGALDLEMWGADGLRVGIGGGSLCTTRIQTGHGVPNVTALQNASRVSNVPIMADGGMRSSGDIAKALAVGADNVMLGSLFAGTKEAPGLIIEKNNNLFKRYRGSASLETKTAHGQVQRNVEGESTVVPFKGGLKYVVERLNDGLRSALSYSGCRSVEEFQYVAEFTTVTPAGILEAKPHLLG